MIFVLICSFRSFSATFCRVTINFQTDNFKNLLRRSINIFIQQVQKVFASLGVCEFYLFPRLFRGGSEQKSMTKGSRGRGRCRRGKEKSAEGREWWKGLQTLRRRRMGCRGGMGIGRGWLDGTVDW